MPYWGPRSTGRSAQRRMVTMHPPATRPTPVATGGHELSLGQEALWFFQQLAPDSGAYNVSGAINLHFPVDVTRMAAAVRTTVSGHGMLNCLFRSTAGEVRRHRCLAY